MTHTSYAGLALATGFVALGAVAAAAPSTCCTAPESWLWPVLAASIGTWAFALHRAGSRAPARPGALHTGVVVTAVSIGLASLAFLATPRPHFPHLDRPPEIPAP